MKNMLAEISTGLAKNGVFILFENEN